MCSTMTMNQNYNVQIWALAFGLVVAYLFA